MQNDSYSLVVSAVRLVGDTENEFEGRVEIYHLGEWGTVCDDFWDLKDATVVCRQLGYSSAVSDKDGAYYGQGSGKIWMDEVSCRGNEISLDLCLFLGWENHNCLHSEDVGVICGKAMYVKVANANGYKNIVTPSVLPVDWCLEHQHSITLKSETTSIMAVMTQLL